MFLQLKENKIRDTVKHGGDSIGSLSFRRKSFRGNSVRRKSFRQKSIRRKSLKFILIFLDQNYRFIFFS